MANTLFGQQNGGLIRFIFPLPYSTEDKPSLLGSQCMFVLLQVAGTVVGTAGQDVRCHHARHFLRARAQQRL